MPNASKGDRSVRQKGAISSNTENSCDHCCYSSLAQDVLAVEKERKNAYVAQVDKIQQ